jgi:hypothetical protein
MIPSDFAPELDEGMFRVKHNRAIPEAIIHVLERSEIKVDMGIFPEIDHAWFIVDNRLILWDLDGYD